MFELDDKIAESIIFAMENQETVFLVDVETGTLLPRDSEPNPEETDQGDIARYEPLPDWTSQDGFRLMEQFSQTLGHPVARAELLSALARGHGVFRAFKNALDAHPETGKKWYEYKERAMKARIVHWYEDLREVCGLARLGLEPEDTEDLLLSDFHILDYGSERWKTLAGVLRAGCEDALGRFPAALVEYEFSALDRALSGETSGEYSLYSAECEPGDCAGLAIVRTLFTGDISIGKLVFLYVDPARRRIGLGRQLVEHAREALVAAGVRYFIVDVPFLWQEFGSSLGTQGYTPFGTRWMMVSDV
jgi:GNAT superfamily N-acetyltransferase